MGDAAEEDEDEEEEEDTYPSIPAAADAVTDGCNVCGEETTPAWARADTLPPAAQEVDAAGKSAVSAAVRSSSGKAAVAATVEAASCSTTEGVGSTLNASLAVVGNEAPTTAVNSTLGWVVGEAVDGGAVAEAG